MGNFFQCFASALIVFGLMLIWHFWLSEKLAAKFMKRYDELIERYEGLIDRMKESFSVAIKEKTIEHSKAINSQANHYRIQIEGLEKALEEAKARSPIPKPSPIPEPKQGDPLSGPPFIPDMPGTTPTKDGGRWVHLG